MHGSVEWKGYRFHLFHARCNPVRRYSANRRRPLEALEPNPWLRSLPSKDGGLPCGGKAPRPGVGAYNKYPHTPYISSHLPLLFASVFLGLAFSLSAFA